MTTLKDLERIEETFGSHVHYLIEGKIVTIDEEQGLGFYSKDDLTVEFLGCRQGEDFMQQVYKITIGDEVRYDFLDFKTTFYIIGVMQDKLTKRECGHWTKKVLDFMSKEYYSIIK